VLMVRCCCNATLEGPASIIRFFTTVTDVPEIA
jgi:hypothetical protein